MNRSRSEREGGEEMNEQTAAAKGKLDAGDGKGSSDLWLVCLGKLH